MMIAAVAAMCQVTVTSLRAGALFSSSGRCSVTGKRKRRGKGRYCDRAGWSGKAQGNRRNLSYVVQKRKHTTLPYALVTLGDFPCLSGPQFPQTGLGDP